MRVLIVLLLGLMPIVAQALEVGERVAPWTLLDQFEQPYTLNDDTALVLVARSMEGGKLVKAVLEGRPKGYLEARKGVFVADVQRMPALIAKLFAIPAMRDYSYRVLLDREGRVASRYPGAEGTVLLLQLEHGRVTAKQELADAQALREALAEVKAR